VGGPFFSPDGEWIVYRAYYPATEEKANELTAMLEERVLRPKGMDLEIYVARPDGSEERAVTRNGKINFAPFFFPDGKRIIFSSNLEAGHSGQYSLYRIGVDGQGIERVSHHDGFDGFPCFSPDGKRLAFISDRNAKQPRELNIFLAEWRE
jgi:Tol biopolymer transport system component